MFLIDSLSLSPQDAIKLVLDALANGRSASQTVVYSGEQPQSMLAPGSTLPALVAQAKLATACFYGLRLRRVCCVATLYERSSMPTCELLTFREPQLT